MNLLEELYNTYERNKSFIGQLDSLELSNGKERDITPLLPVGHTSQHAHITVILDGRGSFQRAEVNARGDTVTIMPATEDSSSRTSGLAAHPLCDKLQYVAGDYGEYVPDKKSGYENYISLLSSWQQSDPEEPALKAVLAYVRKGVLMKDLIDDGVLPVDESGKLIDKWSGDKEATPAIFSVLANGVPSDALVRWKVNLPGEPENKVWKMERLWKSWSDFYVSREGSPGLCYVLGKQAPLAEKHPAKIRNAGDGAKIISSNDKDGYTYRGRLIDSSEVCGVSVEVSQKAHNALRWLISRQGWNDGTLSVVAWSPGKIDIPSPCQDSLSMFGKAEPELPQTDEDIGRRFAKLMQGYKTELRKSDSVLIVALDSASPGRLSVSYFNRFTPSQYLEYVSHWHQNCCWEQYVNKDLKFVGAPSPKTIAEVAYGNNVDEKLRRQTIKRLLPSILEKSPLPTDIVHSCIRRTSNPNGMERWEWEKALGVTCALYRYQQLNKKNYAMSLDPNDADRNYLYGRLLAVAERIENYAQYIGSESQRPTNAEKLMQRFSERPYSTWGILEKAITPYIIMIQKRSPGRNAWFKSVLDDIMDKFISRNDFENDAPLTGAYLLGYHHQRSVLFAKGNKEMETEEKPSAE